MPTKIIIAIIALVAGVFIGSRFVARPTVNTTSVPAGRSPETETLVTAPATTGTKTPSALCTAPPEITDIGSAEYPVDPKYGRLARLGQLFTAADCGPERVKEIFGVRGDRYTLGSVVYLKSGSLAPLAQAFVRAGFRCENTNDTTACRTWVLPDDIALDIVLTLRTAVVPYADIIERDDCVNCG